MNIAEIAAMPTIEYTTLESIDIAPKIEATKSNLKKPIRPQFNPPTINKIVDIRNIVDFDIT